VHPGRAGSVLQPVKVDVLVERLEEAVAKVISSGSSQKMSGAWPVRTAARAEV
jgi:hypothetical protein